MTLNAVTGLGVLYIPTDRYCMCYQWQQLVSVITIINLSSVTDKKKILRLCAWEK